MNIPFLDLDVAYCELGVKIIVAIDFTYLRIRFDADLTGYVAFLEGRIDV